MAPAKKKQRMSNDSAAKIQHVNDDLAHAEAAIENGTTSEESKTDQQRRSIFVRSLPAATTSESLTELFSESYPIKHATAVIDPATKQCRGYGFVTFADAEDAQRAKEEFNGHTIEGRKIRIEIAEPRSRDGDAPADGKSSQATAREPQSTKLIVRNLPWSIKHPDQLSRLFFSYGKVKQAYIPKKGPGLLAGFGFVVMRGRKNAEKAIEGVNGKDVDGRTLAVDWAVAKDIYEEAVNVETTNPESAKEQTDGGIDSESEDDDDDNGVEIDAISSDDDAEEDDTGSEMSQEFDEEEEEEEGTDNHDASEDATDAMHRTEDKSCTLFIRNLPFSCMDEDLEDHFSQFGSIRYARVVMDQGTERSKGTGFVCYYKREDAEACLREAPRQSEIPSAQKEKKDSKTAQTPHSILQNDASDPSGNYTMDGRVLQVSRAVDKSEANRLTEEGSVRRNRRDNDKRRLYLLSEGTMSSKSKVWEALSTTEKAMRDASAKQRKTLIESNPSLHLSLTRLSIRNIPRSVDSRELKALARDAVVGFASDVKAGRRERLSKEELSRGGEEMQKAELFRKQAGRGVVKQAKVVFEGASGSKVSEGSGAGRSRGYGFIEYHTHRNALMGLRWLNGHSVGNKTRDDEVKTDRDDTRERKKRLIVEFAIENAQVVMRRKEREDKARSKGRMGKADGGDGPPTRSNFRGDRHNDSRKRKRDSESTRPNRAKRTGPIMNGAASAMKKPVDEKVAKRNQIIGRKRAMRRARKGAKS